MEEYIGFKWCAIGAGGVGVHKANIFYLEYIHISKNYLFSFTYTSLNKIMCKRLTKFTTVFKQKVKLVLLSSPFFSKRKLSFLIKSPPHPPTPLSPHHYI